jgi:Holliday junction resolvasome RuvABC DNA-binding subunit
MAARQTKSPSDMRTAASMGSLLGRQSSKCTKVLSALRRLGFRDAEARAALSEILAGRDVPSATPEALLREAILRLTPAN